VEKGRRFGVSGKFDNNFCKKGCRGVQFEKDFDIIWNWNKWLHGQAFNMGNIGEDWA